MHCKRASTLCFGLLGLLNAPFASAQACRFGHKLGPVSNSTRNVCAYKLPHCCNSVCVCDVDCDYNKVNAFFSYNDPEDKEECAIIGYLQRKKDEKLQRRKDQCKHEHPLAEVYGYDRVECMDKYVLLSNAGLIIAAVVIMFRLLCSGPRL